MTAVETARRDAAKNMVAAAQMLQRAVAGFEQAGNSRGLAFSKKRCLLLAEKITGSLYGVDDVHIMPVTFTRQPDAVSAFHYGLTSLAQVAPALRQASFAFQRTGHLLGKALCDSLAIECELEAAGLKAISVPFTADIAFAKRHLNNLV